MEIKGLTESEKERIERLYLELEYLENGFKERYSREDPRRFFQSDPWIESLHRLILSRSVRPFVYLKSQIGLLRQTIEETEKDSLKEAYLEVLKRAENLHERVSNLGDKTSPTYRV